MIVSIQLLTAKRNKPLLLYALHTEP